MVDGFCVLALGATTVDDESAEANVAANELEGEFEFDGGILGDCGGVFAPDQFFKREIN